MRRKRVRGSGGGVVRGGRFHAVDCWTCSSTPGGGRFWPFAGVRSQHRLAVASQRSPDSGTTHDGERRCAGIRVRGHFCATDPEFAVAKIECNRDENSSIFHYLSDVETVSRTLFSSFSVLYFITRQIKYSILGESS